MKNKLFILSFLIMCTDVAAQSFNPDNKSFQKPWRQTYFNLSLALDRDHFNEMSLNRMMALSKNPYEITRDLSSMTSDIIPVTAGMAIYSSVGLAPLDVATGQYSTKRELRLGLGLHSPKEAMVAYKSEELDTSIVYCNLHGEFTLEGAYIAKGTFGKHGRCYAGIGVSGGLSFGNEMILISGRYFEPGAHPSEQVDKNPVMEIYAAKSVYYTRCFVPFGIHYGSEDNWSVGLDFRLGLGAQFVSGAQANFIRRTGMFAIGFMKKL